MDFEESLFTGCSGRKSFGEQLNITANLSIWSRLYLAGNLLLSTCPMNPLETPNLNASSDCEKFASSLRAFTFLIANNSISDFIVDLDTPLITKLY
ncbi:hypothetical protein AY601_5055 [Pedobacter cryoconitis]|uniref:Uncharacterized protein n=1 Tax=Pedobacter cryoconitis TaxID=188932 RepID=A0A127VKS2_9SPHI|nr:hypothetical protein AY601_5055 [Pedobacter cryoconitis]